MPDMNNIGLECDESHGDRFTLGSEGRARRSTAVLRAGGIPVGTASLSYASAARGQSVDGFEAHVDHQLVGEALQSVPDPFDRHVFRRRQLGLGPEERFA